MGDKHFYVAYDIESDGNDNAIAVGIVVKNDNNDLLETYCICIPFDPLKLEPRCKAEFWDKQGDLLETLHKRACTSFGDDRRAALITFKRTYDSLITKYRKLGSVYVLTDNPKFDGGILQANLRAEGIDESLDMVPDYIGAPIDTDSVYRGLMHDFFSPWISTDQVLKHYGLDISAYMEGKRMHMPDTDALYIATAYIAIVNKIVRKL